MPTPEEMEQTKKLFVLLNKDQGLVAEYIKRYGLEINAKNLKEVKERKKGGGSAPGVNPVLAARAAKMNAINANNAASAAAAAALAAAGKNKSGASGAAADDSGEQDPIFETIVNCPVCGHTGITSYEMRAKSQQAIQTALLVPTYTGAKGFKTVDYNLLAVTVCPSCLFASPDRKNFNYPSFTGTGEEKSTLPIGVILNIKDKIEEQKALLPEALGKPEYFKRERSLDVAIQSYKLATARAKVEAELAQPYGYFKMGSYALKIAHIMKCKGEDDTEMLKTALEHFEKSFARSECTSDEMETQVVYMTVALNIKLGEFNKANSYLGTFGKLLTERREQMKTNPSLNTTWIEKWQERARYLWEERENPEAFEKLR